MYHYFQGMLSIWHQEQKIFLSDLILIAILVNNAFKTVQQRVKDKEDICRRADARRSEVEGVLLQFTFYKAEWTFVIGVYGIIKRNGI